MSTQQEIAPSHESFSLPLVDEILACGLKRLVIGFVWPGIQKCMADPLLLGETLYDEYEG